MSNPTCMTFYRIAATSAVLWAPIVAFGQETLEEQASGLLGLYACTIVTLNVDHTPGVA